MSGKNNKREKTVMLCMCAVFTALTAVGAYIKIPVPVVPFTLQYPMTMLAGLLLGGKYGSLSVAAYVILGLLGVPVFAEGSGISYVLKPTFGYLLGFIVGTYVTGRIAEGGKVTYKRLLAADFAGMIIVYIFGMVYCYIASNWWIAGEGMGIKSLFVTCFLLAAPGDILFCFLGASLGERLIPITIKYRKNSLKIVKEAEQV